MNIQDLGAFGEFIASIAVLTTLVFLVFEVRRNSKLLIRSNARATYNQEGEALRSLLDGELAEIYLRGHNEGLSSLTEVERYRFDLAFTNYLHAVESAYADFREGYYPAEKLIPFENALPAFLKTPGGAEWWEERQFWFGPDFRNEIQRLLDSANEHEQFSGFASTNSQENS